MLKIYRPKYSRIGKGVNQVRGGSISEIFSDLNRLPVSVKTLLTKYGDKIIKSIKVCRDPIVKGVDIAINMLTLGKVSSNQQALKYDKLFHLYMLIRLENNIFIRLEKNERLYMYETTKDDYIQKRDFENVYLSGRQITLNDLFATTINMVGMNRIVQYDVVTQNCQIFITDVLRSNDILNPTLDKFINQDVRSIVKDIPKPMLWIGNKFVELGRRLESVFLGEGR